MVAPGRSQVIWVELDTSWVGLNFTYCPIFSNRGISPFLVFESRIVDDMMHFDCGVFVLMTHESTNQWFMIHGPSQACARAASRPGGEGGGRWEGCCCRAYCFLMRVIVVVFVSF